MIVVLWDTAHHFSSKDLVEEEDQRRVVTQLSSQDDYS